jgi:zinc D-Ala-D-Ala carboxypeptidase
VTSYRSHLIIAGSIGLVLLVALGFGIYRYVALDRTSDELAAAIVRANAYIAELEGTLADTEQARIELADALAREQAKNDAFENRINDISGTVGTLAKLAATDPELLAKYSKVYFLNENYIPSALTLIDEQYRSDPSRALEFHAQAEPYLVKMLEEAKEDGVEIRIASSYRSFGTQAALKSSYVVSYGSGANRFSADQGYSEHQLGTTVDFTTPALGSAFTSFGDTEAYDWLVENAHRYGFVLSYPEGNTYYMYEPWHWRFVGVKLARDLHKQDKSFYDLEQREINEYLVSLFD